MMVDNAQAKYFLSEFVKRQWNEAQAENFETVRTNVAHWDEIAPGLVDSLGHLHYLSGAKFKFTVNAGRILTNIPPSSAQPLLDEPSTSEGISICKTTAAADIEKGWEFLTGLYDTDTTPTGRLTAHENVGLLIEDLMIKIVRRQDHHTSLDQGKKLGLRLGD